MSDDLGLGLRHHPEAPERRPNYGRRRLAIVLVVLAVLAVLLGGGVAVAHYGHRLFAGPGDYTGSGTGSVVVQIKQGDSLSTIGQRLEKAGVVRSAGAFTAAASNNPKAALIGPGSYRLHAHMKASLALSLLLDPSSLMRRQVLVTEGMRSDAILARIAKDAGIPLAQLQAAAKSPASLGVPSWGRGHPIEGFLFPATYDFPPGTTAQQALTAMVHRFNQAADNVDLVRSARAVGRTPYEALTLASIVQREGRLTKDFPKIAEVFDNRLHRGMRLDSDATLYYLKPLGYGLLTASDLKIDSPYNTRVNAGLPPTPINSPGEEALSSVLHPASGPYLYFVTIDKAGNAAFAKTLAEFNQLVAQSRNNGVK